MSAYFFFGLMITSLWNIYPPVCGIFLRHSEQFWAFIFLYFWPPLGSALRHKCSVCLPQGVLDSSSPECMHRHPFFFVLCPLSLPFPFSLCQCRLSHIVLGPLQSQLCLTRGLPPFSRCVDGASLCIPHSVPFTPSLFSLVCTSRRRVKPSVSPLFSPPPFCYSLSRFYLGECRTLRPHVSGSVQPPPQHFSWFTLCNMTPILLYTHCFEVHWEVFTHFEGWYRTDFFL